MPSSDSGSWVKVENALCCCHDCGKMVKTTWRFFPPSVTYFTIAWCEPCTEKKLM